MFRRKFFVAAVFAALAIFGGTNTSQAAFKLKLDDGTNTSVIDLDSLSVESGTATFSSITGSTTNGVYEVDIDTLVFKNYTINLSSNQTNTPGSASGALLWLDNTYITRGSGASNTLTLTLSATDYTIPDAKTLIGDFDASFPSSTATGTVTETASWDASNTLYGQPSATTLSYTATKASNPETVLYKNLTDPNPGSTYSLTVTLKVTGMGTGVANKVQGDASATVAPAPAGLVMLIGAVPFFGLIRRRLRKSEVATVA